MRVFICNFDLADKVLLFSLYLSARNFLQYPFCTKLLAAPIIADFPLGVFRSSSIRFVSPKFEDCTATVHVCLFSNSGLSILFLTGCLFARFLSVYFLYRILFLVILLLQILCLSLLYSLLDCILFLVATVPFLDFTWFSSEMFKNLFSMYLACRFLCC